MVYSLGQIAQIIDGRLIGDDRQNVEYLLFDSRRVVPSAESLFFAIKSKRDGHNFLWEIHSKGCANYVVEYLPKDRPPGNYLIVGNSLESLQSLARYHRKRFQIPVIGITGSNGKTIVKDWLSGYLARFFNVVSSPKSFNSQIGVPLSVWELSPEHEIAVFEAGISRPGEMAKLESIIQPTIGIFTNLGDAHQSNFKSLEEKLNEKLLLFERCSKIFFNDQQDVVFQSINQRFRDRQLLYWSLSNGQAPLYVKDLNIKQNITELKLEVFGQKLTKIINFTDRASIHNALTVILVLSDLLGVERVKEMDFSHLPQIEMRLQQIRGINNTVIINDTYNCDLTSFRIALDYLVQQATDRAKAVILSDFEQITNNHGQTHTELYTTVAKFLRQAKIGRFIGVGEQINRNAQVFDGINAEFFDTTDELLRHLHTLNFHDEVILIKGARRFRFERISRALQQKSHRTVFEINLNALQHNLNYFRSKLNPQTKVMVMVKAFSYGSGSYEIASLLQAEKVDYLGVAIADEGVELREAGIKLPIIVMNPDSDNFGLFPEYNLEPEIYSFRMLEALYQAVKGRLHYPLPVHIKFNTGMNRLGFNADQAEQVIERLKQMQGTLLVRSVFSHLAGSPEEIFDEFTKKQIAEFQGISEKFKSAFGPQVLAHILNSAGIERFTWAQMDMVRLGIGLYGISSLKNVKLKPIGTLKTRISQIREVKAGESVGYSRAEFVKRNSKIAIIPIGYADGLNRRLSRGRGSVAVRGKLVPIVGNINMDMTMIDVTDVPGVAEDDEVIIFGENPGIEQVAQWLDTIPYEVLTSVSHRVKRVYVWE